MFIACKGSHDSLVAFVCVNLARLAALWDKPHKAANTALCALVLRWLFIKLAALWDKPHKAAK